MSAGGISPGALSTEQSQFLACKKGCTAAFAGGGGGGGPGGVAINLTHPRESPLQRKVGMLFLAGESWEI